MIAEEAKDEDLKRLLPCPFCGGGITEFRNNPHVWTGVKYGDPMSVSVRHWCAEMPGPSRMMFRVLGDCAQDTGSTGACVPALRPHDAARSKQRIGGPHRCAHAWNGRGGETKTAGAATRQVKVCDPRNPRYNDARSLAVGEFMKHQGKCCLDCGFMRRADGNNKPCKGTVRLILRSNDSSY